MTGSDFNVIGWEDQPDEFLNAITRFGITAPQFSLTSQYWKAYAGEGFRDLSFCLAKGDNIRLAVPCYKVGETLKFVGSPLEFRGHDHHTNPVAPPFSALLSPAK